MRTLSYALFSACLFMLVACGDDTPGSESGNNNTNNNQVGSGSLSNLTEQTFKFGRSRVNGEIDDELYVIATGEGTGEVSYTSSDTAIAEIDNAGLLTLKTAGEIVITATIASDSRYHAANATLPVTVNRKKTTISFAVESVDVDVFETTSSIPEVSRDGAYYFHSSNSEVATVDTTGVVTAIGFGTTEITARIPPNNNYESATASYTVSVSRIDQEIEFEPMSAPVHVYAGRSTDVVASALGNVPVRYRTLNENIVRVDDSGKITAIAAGSGVIQAYTEVTDQYNDASLNLPVVVEDVLLSVQPSTNALAFSWSTVSMFNRYRVFKRSNDIEGFNEVFQAGSGDTYHAPVDPLQDKAASFYFEACNSSYCYTSDLTAVSAQGVYEKIVGFMKPDLPATDNKFGQSVDISEDGTRLILGSPNENERRGAVYLYELQDNEWVLHRKITRTDFPDREPGDLLGYGVSISGNGEHIAFSAPGNDITMEEYVERECRQISCPFPDFPLENYGSIFYTKWAEPERFGRVYNDMGPLGYMPKLDRNGTVLLYDLRQQGVNEKNESSMLTRPLHYCCDDYYVDSGLAVQNAIFDISADGQIVITADNRDRNSVVKLNKKGSWIGADYSESPVYRYIVPLGTVNAVSISESGKRFVLVLDTKKFMVFDLVSILEDMDRETWNFELTDMGDLIDFDVANATLSDEGTRIVVSGTDQIVRLLVEDESGWTIQEGIESPNLDSDDCFGCVLAKPNNGDVFVIGAPGEDSATKEDLFDNSISNNGAVYLY
ncbi:hypothetical protein [Reinekea sp. G2M2-21]|uniref:hypothetical protein n=1 Tax=Reinekea sp. G2M2-21 TaxID=2788942 RepID=UPI0018A95C28|nr:hypothetical protein [Reinekea sp. G2M2-21]